jgi:integrase
VEALTGFTHWLAEARNEVVSVPQLTCAHIEEFLAFNARRPCRGRRGRGRSISAIHHTHIVIDLRSFADITAWGWDQPPRTLRCIAETSQKTKLLPCALAPDTDRALMAALADLDDLAARAGITVLRGAGLRLGKLLDLELDCLRDLPGHGTWLKVPLGKLNTERVVPLDDTTLAGPRRLERGARQGPCAPAFPRRPARGLPFTIRGARMGASRIRRGLAGAVRASELHNPDGTPSSVTPHQRRHTYASSLASAGISLQALMTLLGHSRPEMTVRYAYLADGSVRAANDTAMTRLRSTRELPLVICDRQKIPNRIQCLNSEMLKTLVAHGYCSQHLAA